MFRKKQWRINTYHGYGTKNRLRAIGRALKDERIEFTGNTRTFRTVWNIFKQFESDEIKHTEVILKLSDGQSATIETDAEGYYHFDLKINTSKEHINAQGWLHYTISYAEETKKNSIQENIFAGKMLIPSSEADFGIISDIDDTILHTGVASFFKWKLVANTLFKNFDRRLPIEGTVEFYKKLHLGDQEHPVNPIFYVSNSPWNLYDYLTAFLHRHHFPKGPILLRDFRIPFDKTPKRKVPHKQSEIENILNLYPSLNFVLIGDSGEKDADIYTKIAKEFPDRIKAIYLQSVHHVRRERRIKKLIEEFTHVPTMLVSTAQEAEEHARKLGLIK